MKNKLVVLITLVVMTAVIAFAYFGYNMLKDDYEEAKTTTSGQSSVAKVKAADFSVIDHTGKTVTLSDFKGKPVVLNFWASWCPPCRGEMPAYQKIYEESKDKGVVFMMVDLTDGQRETIDKAKQFIKDNDYTFDVYFDTKMNAADAYSVSSIPMSIFIDKNGNVVKSYTGGIDEDTIRSNVEAILQ
ncbi:MAG: hypothetical protein BGN88_08140 [Clostridiales bacterium 43-6]|nr:MAG: hypothetical protein BGN88_08140 [Clostridiales bacterium 43-6]